MSRGSLGSYVPSAVEASLFGITIDEFAKESMILIKKEDVTVKLQRAIDGTATARFDKYVPYRVTFSLQSTASANSWLHLIYKLYETYGADFKMPLSIKDKSGDTSFFCTDVFFESVPDTNLTRNVETSEWVFLCVNPSFTKGGNVDPSEIIETLQALDTALRVANMFGINLNNFASKIESYSTDAMNKIKEMF